MRKGEKGKGSLDPSNLHYRLTPLTLGSCRLTCAGILVPVSLYSRSRLRMVGRRALSTNPWSPRPSVCNMSAKPVPTEQGRFLKKKILQILCVGNRAFCVRC